MTGGLDISHTSRFAILVTTLGALGLITVLMHGLAIRWADLELLPTSVRRRVMWWRRQKLPAGAICLAATITGVIVLLSENALG